jgi:hypothetical protein
VIIVIVMVMAPIPVRHSGRGEIAGHRRGTPFLGESLHSIRGIGDSRHHSTVIVFLITIVNSLAGHDRRGRDGRSRSWVCIASGALSAATKTADPS